ncbi:hypothetical protein ACN47E_007990 [Coniothyrium glycines]
MTNPTRNQGLLEWYLDMLSRPWIQVIAGLLLMLNTWGLINAFGVFQDYYSSFDPPLASASAISWIGSLQLFCLLAFGSATGILVDKGFARTMVFFGCGCITISSVLASFSGEFTGHDTRPVYYQVLLSQGLLAGIGMSLLLVPSTSIIPTYVSKHRAVAVGVANTGASIGGVIYPILVRKLLGDLGFHWAMRVIALVVFLMTSMGFLLLRQRRELIEKRPRRILYDVKCMSEIHYALFAVGVAFGFAGLFIPYFYLTTWVRDTAFPLRGGLQPYHFLSILNAGGLLGRVAPSMLADRVPSGPALVQGLAALGCALLAGIWLLIETSFAGLLCWTLAYGFCSGSVISLIPATAAMLTKDMGKLGGRIGLVFAMNAFASLLGSPVAGAVLKNTPSGWTGLALYSAALNLASGSLLMACWTATVWKQRSGPIESVIEG